MEAMNTLSQKIKELKTQGFTEDFYFEGGKLAAGDQKFSASDIKDVKEFRFEGKSNPDDLSIVYQIETSNGTKGSIVDGFGPTADPELSQFLVSAEKR